MRVFHVERASNFNRMHPFFTALLRSRSSPNTRSSCRSIMHAFGFAASVITEVRSKEDNVSPVSWVSYALRMAAFLQDGYERCAMVWRALGFVYHRCRCTGQRARSSEFNYILARVFARLDYSGGETHCSHVPGGSSCVAQGSVFGPLVHTYAPGQFFLRQFARWESACRLYATPLCVSYT